MKFYSKYSTLFRNDPIFPDKLKFSLLNDEIDNNEYETQAIISKLLACNLDICEISGKFEGKEYPLKLVLHEVVFVVQKKKGD